MPHAYLVITRVSAQGGTDVLLAQKNLYLPPWGRYQYASIAGNAGQFVLPGGLIQPNEAPAEAAAREFFEDSGIAFPTASLVPLLSDDTTFWAFQVKTDSSVVDVDSLNGGLQRGRFGSLKFNNMHWCALEEAPGRLGRHPSIQNLPWVGPQITRALQAGFSRELIGMRANESCGVFTRPLAKLMLEPAPELPGADPGAASEPAPLASAAAS